MSPFSLVHRDSSIRTAWHMAQLGAGLLATLALAGCGGATVREDEAGTGGSGALDGSGDDGQSASGASTGDGGTSSTPASADLEAQFSAVTYADGRFVAVGMDSTDWDDNGNEPAPSLIITSNDGRTWSRAYREEGGGHLHSVAFGNGTWVAVGWDIWDDGDFVYSQTLVTSTDGITWTPGPTPDAQTLDQVVWSGEQFLLLGDGQLFRSIDALNWTTQTTVPFELPLAVGPLGVVAGASMGTVFSSDHGATWKAGEFTPHSWLMGLYAEGDGFSGWSFYDCCFGEVAGTQEYYDLHSDDGINWDLKENTSGYLLTRFAQHDTASAGIDSGEGMVFRPTGETRWTRSSFADNDSFSDVATDGTLFVAVGDWRLRWSEDGVDWARFDSLD